MPGSDKSACGLLQRKVAPVYHTSTILQRIHALDTERRTILNKHDVRPTDQARLVQIREDLQQLWHKRRCELADIRKQRQEEFA